MAARPDETDSASSGAAELDRLEHIRLANDWSYRELSDDMRRVNVDVPDKTLHSLLKNRPNPYDRTLYKIRQYLTIIENEKRATA